jgi:hypothetical protein
MNFTVFENFFIEDDIVSSMSLLATYERPFLGVD